MLSDLAVIGFKPTTKNLLFGNNSYSDAINCRAVDIIQTYLKATKRFEQWNMLVEGLHVVMGGLASCGHGQHGGLADTHKGNSRDSCNIRLFLYTYRD